MSYSLLRSRGESCLSDRSIDRHLAGDLDDEEACAFHHHLSDCAVCKRRHDELSSGLAEFSKTRPLLRKASSSYSPWRRHMVPAISALALAAAAMLIFDTDPVIESGVRIKGAASIGFFVRSGNRIRTGAAHEVVFPGDAIRFSYSSAEASYLTILSVDGSGQVSQYFPAGDEPYRATAGANRPLPLATELDAVLGPETLYGIFCQSPVPPASLRLALEASAPASPSIPAECAMDTLEWTKEPRR